MQCIRNTDIPIPIGCNEWTIVSKFDHDNILPETLEKLMAVRVGRDYHSSGIHEHMSPFSAIYNLEEIQYIISVCGIDYLFEYVDPRTNGNIMHAAAINPNIEVIKYIIDLFGEEASKFLINSYDNEERRVIELAGYNRQMFELLTHYTTIESEYAVYLIKTCPVAKLYLL